MDLKFSKNRKQSVIVDGKQSSLIGVVSGVQQGTVLGLLFFILLSSFSYSYFILMTYHASVVSSKVRLLQMIV